MGGIPLLVPLRNVDVLILSLKVQESMMVAFPALG